MYIVYALGSASYEYDYLRCLRYGGSGRHDRSRDIGEHRRQTVLMGRPLNDMPEAVLAKIGLSRETSIRRDRMGNWFYEDDLIENPKIKLAFDAWVDVAPDGRYCLRNDLHWVYVNIDGPPVWVQSLNIEAGAWMARLSSLREVQVEADRLFTDVETNLYLDLGNPGFYAGFSNHAYAQLMPIVGSDERGIYLDMHGQKVRPRNAEMTRVSIE